MKFKIIFSNSKRKWQVFGFGPTGAWYLDHEFDKREEAREYVRKMKGGVYILTEVTQTIGTDFPPNINVGVYRNREKAVRDGTAWKCKQRRGEVRQFHVSDAVEIIEGE